MTWSDPIVEEVRRARDAYAARFNYDLQAIFRDLKEQEKRSGRKAVSYARNVDSETSGDSNENGGLADELLATDPKFQSLVAKSKASPRKPFVQDQ